MPSLSVIKNLYVFAYCALCFVASREVSMMNHFCFQTSPKAFHRCVVEAVSFSGHRNSEMKLPQDASIFFRAVLTASIRVVNDSGSRAMLLDRSEQSSPSQLRLHPLSHRITHDLAREDVFDSSQVQPA